ncbi:MAG: hypothetical protein CVT77_10740 [Alphaproteobacteria bacterium HGW-Alphaproteobacteria-16]|nr:MAG: hypothetical protein CVT77_10740 [Alphaproteobacteria bacterium HGW-Alphaproteobacteria-16]
MLLPEVQIEGGFVKWPKTSRDDDPDSQTSGGIFCYRDRRIGAIATAPRRAKMVPAMKIAA